MTVRASGNPKLVNSSGGDRQRVDRYEPPSGVRRRMPVSWKCSTKQQTMVLQPNPEGTAYPMLRRSLHMERSGVFGDDDTLPAERVAEQWLARSAVEAKGG